MKLREFARVALLEEIEKAKHSETKKLPTEKELSEKLNISRVTLRSALAELELEGKLLRQQGKGTFVNPNILNMKIDISRMKAYGEIITNMGYKLHIDVQTPELVDTPIEIKKNGAFNNEQVYKCSRIFYADGSFCALCVDYLPYDFHEESEKIKNYPESIFRYLYKTHGIKLDSGNTTLEVVDSREIFNIINKKIYLPTNSLLLIKGMEYDQHFNPILYTNEYINTSIIKLSTIRRRDIDYTKY